MAGAMLLAAAVLGMGKVVCSVTYSVTSLVKELAMIHVCCVCAANLEFSSLQLPEVVESVGIGLLETQNTKHSMQIASYCNTRTTK